MLKLKLIDREVEKAMEGDEELYDLVKQTEDLLDEILNMSNVCINDISDNDIKFTNDSISLLKSTLVMAANERMALFTILDSLKSIVDKIKDIDRKIDKLNR